MDVQVVFDAMNGCTMSMTQEYDKIQYAYSYCPHKTRFNEIQYAVKRYVGMVDPQLVVRTGIPKNEVIKTSLKMGSGKELSPVIPLPAIGINILGVYWPYLDQYWFNMKFTEGPGVNPHWMERLIQEYTPRLYKEFAPNETICELKIPIYHPLSEQTKYLTLDSYDVSRGTHNNRLKYMDENGMEHSISVESSNRCLLKALVEMNTRFKHSKWTPYY